MEDKSEKITITFEWFEILSMMGTSMLDLPSVVVSSGAGNKKVWKVRFKQ